MKRRFNQVDVFGLAPYLGNPLAVVLEGAGLSDDHMQSFARWTNLSETTFLLPPSSPDADYAVRIFTPARELPFAGHPTLGSAHAWLAAGGVPRVPGRIVQECGVGHVHLRLESGQLAFRAPPLRRTGALEDAILEQIARGLRVPLENILHHQHLDNGPGWVGVVLPSAQDVLDAEPDYAALNGLELGVIGAHPAGSAAQFEVRAFITQDTAPYEDPVTGSLNAAFAQWLIPAGLAPARYTAAQGTRLNRAGRVYLEHGHLEQSADGAVWVGGATVTCVDGTVEL
jgi:PhzF family phenazine biosynthesis protein